MAPSPLLMRFERAGFVTVTQYYVEKDVDHPLEQLLPAGPGLPLLKAA